MIGTRKPSLTRRTFLRDASAAALGTSLMGSAPVWGEEAPAAPEPPGLNKRTLGRTGLDVTDIAFGGIQIQNERLLDVAIGRGINYIHTSPGYGGGVSIELFGKVMARRRQDVYLALKASPIGGIDQHLQTLKTDYVDVLVPPLHDVASMNNPQLEGAYAALKEQGKIRFSGYACHSNIADVMNLSVDLGYFDVMLIAYNLANREELDPILARAKEEQNMGFMAMKTTRGIGEGGHAAAFKSLLSNANVDTLLVGMASFSEVEANVAVSGRSTGLLDRLQLREYAYLGTTGCSMCGKCDVCPQGVAVADALRCGLYEERGEHDLAATTYAGLGRQHSAAQCTSCGLCTQNCPRRRPVHSELQAIHAALA